VVGAGPVHIVRENAVSSGSQPLSPTPRRYAEMEPADSEVVSAIEDFSGITKTGSKGNV